VTVNDERHEKGDERPRQGFVTLAFEGEGGWKEGFSGLRYKRGKYWRDISIFLCFPCLDISTLSRVEIESCFVVFVCGTAREGADEPGLSISISSEEALF
jgi:hypothetical protein